MKESVNCSSGYCQTRMRGQHQYCVLTAPLPSGCTESAGLLRTLLLYVVADGINGTSFLPCSRHICNSCQGKHWLYPSGRSCRGLLFVFQSCLTGSVNPVVQTYVIPLDPCGVRQQKNASVLPKPGTCRNLWLSGEAAESCSIERTVQY